ncbi:MAG: hypothetical protein JWL57_1804, partial [Actinobacteria bacterium]|nr:hypothetical protein [Actinomycetota bacterium]
MSGVENRRSCRRAASAVEASRRWRPRGSLFR